MAPTYDIRDGKFHLWRKNRQPTPGSSYIGTDLNRNYGYKWGGGGKTSTNPQAITYRGPKAFSAPETRAMRDFMASRVVGGVPADPDPHHVPRVRSPGDVAVRLHLHERAERHDDRRPRRPRGDRQARWPPPTATSPSRRATCTSPPGTTRDYAYGTYRIFSYTFELSTKDYPDDSKIATETGRNKEAVLYLIERAWCPLGVLGAAKTAARCGAFDDDLEVARGWTVDPDGTDTALDGDLGAVQPGEPVIDLVVRRQAARDDHVGLEGLRDRRGRRQFVDGLRPRRSDDRSARGPSPSRPGPARS